MVVYETQTDKSTLIFINTETKILTEIFIIYVTQGSLKYAVEAGTVMQTGFPARKSNEID